MLQPPNMISGVIYSVVASAIIAVLSGILLRKKQDVGIFVVAIFFYSAFILYLVLGTTLPRLYANQALPYVQESLDKTCGVSTFVVTADDIYSSSGWQWSPKESDALCYLSGDRWECRCGQVGTRATPSPTQHP